jgi:hypothetical protein
MEAAFGEILAHALTKRTRCVGRRQPRVWFLDCAPNPTTGVPFANNGLVVNLTLDPQTITAQIILEARVAELQATRTLAEAFRELTQLKEALARIAEGTWGRCEQCDAAIGRGRLRAIPEATRCVACAHLDT